MATSAGVLLGFSPILLLILAVYFVASLYLTSMISFSSVTVTTRHSFGPPSSFDWMDLAQLWSTFYNHCLGPSDLDHSSSQDNIQRIKEKKENSHPWGKNITWHELSKNQSACSSFTWCRLPVSLPCSDITNPNSMIPSFNFIESAFQNGMLFSSLNSHSLGGSPKSRNDQRVKHDLIGMSNPIDHNWTSIDRTATCSLCPGMSFLLRHRSIETITPCS